MALRRLLQSRPLLTPSEDHHLLRGLRLLLVSRRPQAEQYGSLADGTSSTPHEKQHPVCGSSSGPQGSQSVQHNEGQYETAGTPWDRDEARNGKVAGLTAVPAASAFFWWAPTLPPIESTQCCHLSASNQLKVSGGLQEETHRVCSYTPLHRPRKVDVFGSTFTSAKPTLPFDALDIVGGQRRTFRSSSHQANWFSPSRQPSSPPPSETVIREDPVFPQETFAEDRGSEPEIEFADLWPKSEKSNEAPSEVSLPESNWAIWDFFAPISGFIIVALDGVHSFTGMPWWLTIITTTALMRSALVPLVFLQIKKTAQLSNIFMEVVKASPPGTSFLTQLQRFTVARQAANGSNPMWVVAVPTVQIPLFVSASLALRQMATDGHPGFDTGGLLWFADLTLPAGLGLEAAIFPVVAIGLYLTNIQVAFGGLAKRNRFLRIYKGALQALAMPVFMGSFYLPQAMLLYWVTNNFCSFAQNVAVRSNYARSALGLPRVREPAVQEAGLPITDALIENMDVNQLLDIAATCEAEKRTEEAIKFLKKAHVKAPEEASIFYALGKTHAVLKKWEEAAEYHAQAAVHAREDELQGKALYGHGIALFNQGKVDSAVEALREAASLRPEFLEGQLSFASILSRNGNKAEALKVLRKAARLEPKIQKYINDLEQELRTQANAANRAKGKR